MIQKHKRKTTGRDGRCRLFRETADPSPLFLGGTEIDESWRENDGLVNTLSAKAPLGAPAQPLDRDAVRPGIWNVLPIVEGDHMWPQGGLLRRYDIRDFYRELLAMIDETAK